MTLIDEKTNQQLRQRFQGSLSGPVELRLRRRPDTGRVVLPGGTGCATCDTAEDLMRELVETAPDKLRLTVTDIAAEGPDQAVPSLTVAAPDAEGRITFQGLASGYEFATLLDAIERVSRGGDQLGPEAAASVAGLTGEVEVMVFVTPTCPYCPAAASMANRMALTSPLVRSLVVEANEFPELSDQFQVQGVPRTVVNRSGAFVGALPEGAFVESVLRLAAGAAAV